MPAGHGAARTPPTVVPRAGKAALQIIFRGRRSSYGVLGRRPPHAPSRPSADHERNDARRSSPVALSRATAAVHRARARRAARPTPAPAPAPLRAIFLFCQERSLP